MRGRALPCVRGEDTPLTQGARIATTVVVGYLRASMASTSDAARERAM